MQDDENDWLRRLLGGTRSIAVVGLSASPARPSHRVAAYLLRAGYRVVPVNPHIENVLGQRAVPTLADISAEQAVDMVNVFRREEDIPAIAAQAVECGAKSFWQQLGLANREADAAVRARGLDAVMDKCIMVEHQRLFGAAGQAGQERKGQ